MWLNSTSWNISWIDALIPYVDIILAKKLFLSYCRVYFINIILININKLHECYQIDIFTGLFSKKVMKPMQSSWALFEIKLI